MAVRERVEGGRAALQCDLLMMVLPGAYLLLANNTAVDLFDAPCYLDLEYQYPCRICGLYTCISVSYSVARGCSMLNHIELLHVLHMHLLRLAPQCDAFV